MTTTKTFDTSRVGGGTYELHKDATTGSYSLKSVGFAQVNKLTLPELASQDAATKTTTTTKTDTKTDTTNTADPYKQLSKANLGDNNKDLQISQNYERFKPKDISVRQAGDAMTKDAKSTRQNFDQSVKDLQDASTIEMNEAQIAKLNAEGASPQIMAQAQARLDKAKANEYDMYRTGVSGKPTGNFYQDAITRGQVGVKAGSITPERVTGLQAVKSKASDTVNSILNNSATVTIAKGIGTIIGGISNALIDPYQRDLNQANKSALSSLGYKTNFELGISTDPGRIAGNPAKDVFAGMNAQSAFGDISKGAQSRIDTRNKTAAKKAGTWSQEKLDKFNAKTKDFERQKAEHDKAAAKDKANAKAAKDNREGTGGSCFIAGTKVTMSDGTFKNIENIVVGDKVKGHKEDNTVIKLDPTLLADRKLYSFNDNEHYFFTSEHPFMTEEGWKSIKPEKTKERDGVELYEQLKGELKIGDKLVTDNGSVEIKDIKSKEISNPEMPLYNFNVSNDNSYIADNYVVHNKGCFIKGTLVTMADGSNKPVEQVDLGDKVAEGGLVFAVGKFLNTELYDYKGIKVSGSHMVNEDGIWMRVRDTKHGKSLGNDLNTVYVFGSENRRILINDILFTDYFEVNEQDQLINSEKDFFNNWKNYGNTIDEHNVNTLNAS